MRGDWVKKMLTGAGIYLVGWGLTLVLQLLLPYSLSIIFRVMMAAALAAVGGLSAMVNARWGKDTPRSRPTFALGLAGTLPMAGLSWALCMTGNSLYLRCINGLSAGLNWLARGYMPTVRLRMDLGFLQLCAALVPLSYYICLVLMRPDGRWAVFPQARDEE